MEKQKVTGYREMTKDEATVFIAVVQANHHKRDIEPLFNELKSADGGWVLEAINKHCEILSSEIKIDKSVQIIILTIGDGTIGYCLQHLAHIVEIAKSKNIDNITIQEFSEQIYPMSIPLFNNEKVCQYKKGDYGMFGIPSYEYSTECGKNYDTDKITSDMKHCPNCGNKIIR